MDREVSMCLTTIVVPIGRVIYGVIYHYDNDDDDDDDGDDSDGDTCQTEP